MAKMDVSSYQLANEMGLPHDAVLSKLKKYRNGAEYTLSMALYGPTTNQFGEKENIYMLSRAEYEACVKKEEDKRKANSAKQSAQGAKNIKFAHAANAKKVVKK